MEQFKTNEKLRAFDDIAKHFYDKNFGTMTKTDYETLLFWIYLRHLKAESKPYDDYSISRALGITQSKVRSLKMRIELRESLMTDDSWKEEFAACIKTAIYDKRKKLVKVIIPEVTVMMELRHFMEENRWYDEYQLNPKLFQCPLDFFPQLCEKIGNTELFIDDETKNKLEEIIREAAPEEASALSKILKGGFEDGFKELAWVGTTTIVIEVLKVLPFGGIASSIISALISVLEKSMD